MKNGQLLLVGLVSSLAITSNLKADTVVLTQNAYSFSVGGEFNAVTTGQSFVQNYAPQAVLNGGFQTFCIETTVDFTPGTTYTYNLSSEDSMGRALTEGAAFLYYEFGTGQLAGYDYTDAATRQADAGELQAAIWWLQGNQTYSGYPDLSSNPFLALATNTLGLASAEAANNGAYGVEVLQMWSGTTPAQNQLVLVGVPDGGSTLLMLGAGLGILSLAGLPQFRNRLTAVSNSVGSCKPNSPGSC